MNVNRNETGLGSATDDRTRTGSGRSGSGKSMRRVLWWLIGSTRGGKNRLRIVRAIQEQPMNTNQLSKELDLNYKTVEHHLERLVENGVLLTNGEEYGTVFFLSDRLEQNLDVLDEIAEEVTADDEDL